MQTKDAIREFFYELIIQNYTERTVRGYKGNIARFNAFIEKEFEITELEEISKPHIKKYIFFLQQKGLTSVYINTILKNLRSLFKYRSNEGYCSNIAEKVGWLKEKKTVIQTFTDAEVKKIITNFTLIDNDDIISNITDGAFRTYTLIKSMCYGDKNTCYPSQKYLAKKLNKNIRTIQRYLIELVQAKMIKIKRKGSISNVYTVMSKVTSTVGNAVKKAKKAYDNHFKKKKDSADIKKTKFNDYEQRNYNYENLEQMLLGEMEYDVTKLLE
ncbi:helix-turn-helix domain-containing protein [Clostridium pasteurianum]|uniref:Site-specific recombinase XerD n=1 Tax=Clostridium pasteurianum BC1 TaxID=86416 RepID=R4K5I4_CLOPA|nr:helix-turn-helix domain-containing protein [Clostridium pasteurianum]AGK97833.1 site-specific recombinase XerD [Clostridium pasteurianum BC1]